MLIGKSSRKWKTDYVGKGRQNQMGKVLWM